MESSWKTEFKQLMLKSLRVNPENPFYAIHPSNPFGADVETLSRWKTSSARVIFGTIQQSSNVDSVVIVYSRLPRVCTDSVLGSPSTRQDCKLSRQYLGRTFRFDVSPQPRHFHGSLRLCVLRREARRSQWESLGVDSSCTSLGESRG